MTSLTILNFVYNENSIVLQILKKNCSTNAFEKNVSKFFDSRYILYYSHLSSSRKLIKATLFDFNSTELRRRKQYEEK